MTMSNQTLWSTLTEAQRARIIAMLVRMLLRQLAQRREAKSA